MFDHRLHRTRRLGSGNVFYPLEYSAAWSLMWAALLFADRQPHAAIHLENDRGPAQIAIVSPAIMRIVFEIEAPLPSPTSTSCAPALSALNLKRPIVSCR
jgi:hypothetical protein